MRPPTLARYERRLLMLAAMLVAAGSTGCATLRATAGSYEIGRNGIAKPQQRLREALVRADFPAALGQREDDQLLHALNIGASTFYALQFSRSASVLDSAALLADDRITTSLSRSALALVTNDLALAYQPRRTERLFIPYYSMLAYARLEQWEDAAVEARRLSALLTQFAPDRTDDERSTHATLHALAGAVFERAGERGEAQVSYRNARALAPQADSARPRYASGEGEVVIVVERGFVAHRVTESIDVFIGGEDRDSLRGGDDDRWSRAVARIAGGMSPDDGRHVRRGRKRHHDDDDDDGYWLAIAFPSLRRSTHVPSAPAVLLDGVAMSGAIITGSIDDATSADAGRERTGMIVRGLARAAARYAITRAVKDKKGDVAGTVVNIGASLLERADIRSWHLLPQEISVVRLRVPAGLHQLQVVATDDSLIDLGPVTVHDGRVTITSTRIWSQRTATAVASR